jgi:hypothetical protein
MKFNFTHKITHNFNPIRNIVNVKPLTLAKLKIPEKLDPIVPKIELPKQIIHPVSSVIKILQPITKPIPHVEELNKIVSIAKNPAHIEPSLHAVLNKTKVEINNIATPLKNKVLVEPIKKVIKFSEDTINKVGKIGTDLFNNIKTIGLFIAIGGGAYLLSK